MTFMSNLFKTAAAPALSLAVLAGGVGFAEDAEAHHAHRHGYNQGHQHQYHGHQRHNPPPVYYNNPQPRHYGHDRGLSTGEAVVLGAIIGGVLNGNVPGPQYRPYNYVQPQDCREVPVRTGFYRGRPIYEMTVVCR